MEYIILFAGIIILLIFVMIRGMLEDKRKAVKFREALIKNYGGRPQKEYNPEQYESLKRYFQKHKEGFQIDDITWNDLGMDNIFLRMDYTFSSAGTEYLYYKLRTPSFEEHLLQRFQEQTVYYMEHEKERVEQQLLFARLGTTGKFSLYDYLDYLDALGERKNRKHYLAVAVMAGALLCMFISASAGTTALIIAIVYNICSYFHEKREIEPYMTSIAYILRLLKAVDELEKTDITPVQEEMKALRTSRQKFKQFVRGSFWLTFGIRSGGNPLDIAADYVKMIFHVDLIVFNRMIGIIRKYTQDIDCIVTNLGYLETVLSTGAYRASLEECCIPEWTSEKGVFFEDIYHPLLEEPVKNSLHTRGGILLTGSNASGKSTFLKTVAVNCLLAQTFSLCLGKRYRSSFFRLYSSMALKDDITSGDSYYMVEIKALKRILDAVKLENAAPVLCIVDEVLRGTNTLERIAASSQILKSLTGQAVLCFAATHDIELTHLLEKKYDNYHFEEDIIEGDVVFNYQLKTGRATTRNAIKLLAVMGYETDIIEAAGKMAEEFTVTGEWKMGG